MGWGGEILVSYHYTFDEMEPNFVEARNGAVVCFSLIECKELIFAILSWLGKWVEENLHLEPPAECVWLATDKGAYISTFTST